MNELESHKLVTWRGMLDFVPSHDSEKKTIVDLYHSIRKCQLDIRHSNDKPSCSFINLKMVYILLIFVEELQDYNAPLIHIDPDASLYEGVRVLLQHKVLAL